MSRSAQFIRDFVVALDLPDLGPQFESAAPPALPQFTDHQEVVTVGAQLAEFSPSVATELRPLIANSMLLAQLAANKANAQAGSVFDWHRKYRDVLSNIGWTVHASEEQVQEVNNRNLGVHKAIIPVLTAMLGPAAAATSLVVSVLQGLNEMDAQTPWITLFDQSSQHASGAKFQISYIDADAHGQPVISLLACSVTAEKSITQVLFFKFSNQKAELRKSTAALATTAERLKADKDVIAGRVQSFVSDYVKNIEI
ncbi:hypothetical protein [Povalibacter sp.]|uniref:hypothetical protein n=1 Tax=Povalibacter sp. TaxID=1962978 RepID=UPI002F42C4D3